jgi:tetratricopeptide (TPR) repeat protein
MIPTNKNKWAACLAIAALLLTLISCTSPEKKKTKFYEHGVELYKQENYGKAKVEFRNALQIDPKYADAYFMLGKMAMDEQDPRSAYGNFSRTLELNPAHHGASLQLAKLHLAGHDLKGAEEKIAAVLGADRDNYEALLLEATVQIIKEDPDRAVVMLQKLLQHREATKEAYELLAVAYDKQKQPGKAEEVLNRGVAAFPDAISTRIMLSRLYIGSGQKAKAIDTLEKMIKVDARSMDSRLELAVILLNSGDQEKGVAVLQAAALIDPGKEDNWLKIADFLAQRNLPKEALNYLQQGLTSNRSSFLLRFRLSDLYVSQNRFDDAIKINKECLTLTRDEQDQNLARAHDNLARIYIMLGELEQAEKAVQLALKSNPKSVDAHFTQGNLYLQQGRPGDAVSEFRWVQKEKPEFIAGRTRLAEAYMRNKQPQLAKDSLQEARREFPDNSDLAMTLARIYLLEDDSREAVDLYRDMLIRNPGEQQIRAELGDLYLISRQDDKALKIYEEIKKTTPEIPVGYLKMAQWQLAHKNPGQAISILTEGLGRLPDSQPLMEQLVQVYIQAGKFREAEAFCRSLIQKNPQSSYPYNLLGTVQMKEKNLSGAEASFRRAAGLDEMWAAPLENLAVVLLLQGQKDKAVATFRESLRINPRNPVLYGALAQIYEQEGDVAKAKELYEKGLKELPNDWSVANNYAYLLARTAASREELTRSLVLAKKALRLDPENLSVLDTIGWVLYRLEEYPQAATYLEKALAKGNPPAELSYHHAMVMYKSGQSAQAIRSLKQALAGDARFPWRDEADKLLKTLTNKS